MSIIKVLLAVFASLALLNIGESVTVSTHRHSRHHSSHHAKKHAVKSAVIAAVTDAEIELELEAGLGLDNDQAPAILAQSVNDGVVGSAAIGSKSNAATEVAADVAAEAVIEVTDTEKAILRHTAQGCIMFLGLAIVSIGGASVYLNMSPKSVRAFRDEDKVAESAESAFNAARSAGSTPNDSGNEDWTDYDYNAPDMGDYVDDSLLQEAKEETILV